MRILWIKGDDPQSPPSPLYMTDDLFQMRVGLTFLYLTEARAQLTVHTPVMLANSTCMNTLKLPGVMLFYFFLLFKKNYYDH